jgi:hypothetical protein
MIKRTLVWESDKYYEWTCTYGNLKARVSPGDDAGRIIAALYAEKVEAESLEKRLARSRTVTAFLSLCLLFAVAGLACMGAALLLK